MDSFKLIKTATDLLIKKRKNSKKKIGTRGRKPSLGNYFNNP